MKRKHGFVLWGVLALWALGLGGAHAYRHFGIGRTIIREVHIDARTLRGDRVPLGAPDSATVILATLADCSTCRIGVPDYTGLARSLRDEGIALRVMVSSPPMPARQYGSLYPDDVVVIDDSSEELFAALGLRQVPSLILLDPAGSVVGRIGAPFPADLPDLIRTRLSPVPPAGGAPPLPST